MIALFMSSRDALTFAYRNERAERPRYGDVRLSLGGGRGVREEGERGQGQSMEESQLVELRSMRVLLEEARVLGRDLAYHRRVRLEAVLGLALEEVDRQIEELRGEGRG
jgi:hypothetical protein